LQAAAWGAWIHGKAGNILAETIGEVGFLARELLPLIPALIEKTMRTQGSGEDVLP
jgi:NAD(P)H-hydrate repair Nnr-like enzyme with NAD(P)H-hydrate dehydratase domain